MKSEKVLGKKRMKLRKELEEKRKAFEKKCKDYRPGRYSDTAIFYIERSEIEKLEERLKL